MTRLRWRRRAGSAGPQAQRREGPISVRLSVNGHTWSGDVPPGEMLLDTLRARLNLPGAKRACGRGECGSCTVLIEGKPRMACITAVATVDAPVTTIEGLSVESEALRGALADAGGFQCGYCTPGQVVAAMALLQRVPDPNEEDVRREMAGNICRCTGYTPIIDAVLVTAKTSS
jgi:aerobic-type carbon monoxide dehydrogenase small subunit (CoxS/CutS family)